MIERLVVILISLAAAAIFGVGLVGARGSKEAEEILFERRNATPAELHRADELLRRARRLSVDETPNLLRASVLVRLGRLPAATRVVQDVTGREPRNVDAWELLMALTQDSDPRRSRAAAARARALKPPVPRRS